jgi:thymidylate synthase
VKYVSLRAFDCPDAWFRAVAEIWTNGELFEVKYGSECSLTKKLNLSIEILHPENRPLVDDHAPCDKKYVESYALTYLYSGEKYEETYTYGSRLRKPVDQIEEAIKRYLEEQNDRQVTMVIRIPEDINKRIKNETHEPPCLSLIDTEIMDGQLHWTCYFRSWDAYAGLPANIAGLQLLRESMVSEINQRGNRNIQPGKFIFHSKNCHIYQRQFSLVENLLNRKVTTKHSFTLDDKNGTEHKERS